MLDLGGTGGGSLAAIAFGDPARPVDTLFLHANGFNALTYRSLLEPIAAGQHIVAVDQRGHGRTALKGAIDGRRSWDDLTADLVALLDRVQGPPVTLAGHSMGATVSLLAAVQRPERVRRLVLFDPVILPWPASAAIRFGFPARRIKALETLASGALRRRPVFPSRDAAYAAYKGRGAFKTWQDRQLADYVADGFDDRPDGTVELACPPAWEASNFLSQAQDVWAALKRARCPVHILRAERGSPCSLRTSLRSEVAVETVPGTTHFLPLERPDLVRKTLAST